MADSSLQHVNLDAYLLPDRGVDNQETIIPDKKHWKVNSRLTQLDKKNKKKLVYTRFNNRFLSYKQISKNDSKEVVIDLAYLHKTCVEKKHQPNALLLIAALILLLSGIAFVIAPFNPLYLIAPAAISLLFTFLGIKSRTHVYRFYTLAGKIPVLEILAASPNKKAVSAFLKDIVTNIAKAKQKLPKGKNLIPLAVVEMRRLEKAGLISQKQYDHVKKVLFNH